MRSAGGAAPTVFAAPWSRLVVDVDLFADPADEVMASRGMSAVYTRDAFGAVWRDEGDPLFVARSAELVERFYEPYHAALSALVADVLAAHGRCLIIDVHSYPTAALPDELPHDLRPQVCIGTDAFHTSAELEAASVGAFVERGFDVALNTPFAGALVPKACYSTDPAVQAVMVEIRRDQNLESEPGGSPSAEAIDTLAHGVAAIALTF
ncbi:MAG: hypothetical protein RLZ55_574 [Actinomycetota bacterium]